MKTILITGANGQLGNSMRAATAGSINRYIFTDVAELDITDRNAVINTVAKEKVDVIVNCAAYTNVDKAEDDTGAAFRLNCTAVENLAAAAKREDATLIHISTDYVFEGNANKPITEEEKTNPQGVYGRTKLAGEEAVIATGCKHIILRTAWLYSPYGKNFVKTMQQLTSSKEKLNVVFDQVGTPTYAADLAELICHIIENDKLHIQGTFHYSNEGVCSWYDFAKEICELSGNSCDIQPCHSNEFPTKVKRPHFSVLDKTKVKSRFGITIPHWKESLRKCVKELATNNYFNSTHFRCI
ncbi:MAG: dTDP-4-dehydrorhamnose reductase [Bacteroidaceae bacterium]|nr:dTDP-4-dehydrorhamnose reductase [Bacteroidaceae bacterium]